MNEMLEYALMYARNGLAVFPLRPRSKQPAVINGFKNATLDEMQIETWWNNNPNYNIGIATGEASNGVCVIDMDIKDEEGGNGIEELDAWQKKFGSFVQKTWVSRTGNGGMHYFFKADKKINCRTRIIPYVDIRGDGGYIVAPPSIHDNGNVYQWCIGCSPEEIQVTPINKNIEYFLNHDRELPARNFSAPDIIPEGQRNDILFRTACSLQSKGLSDEAIFAAVERENEAKCNPPLSNKELNTIINSALKYKKGKPILLDTSGNASQGKRSPIFDLTKEGKIKKTIHNMEEAIEYSPDLYGKIKYNELTNSIFVYGSLPWDSMSTYRPWKNSDDSNLKSFLERNYGFVGEKINDALVNVSDRNKFNPIIEELEQIKRDYKECDGSIRKLLVEYMGADDNEYNYEVMKTFMLGAITRIYSPGCKFDYTLIIYGEQGFGKSEFLRRLAICSEWFNDNMNTVEGDKASEKLAGMWIVEMAELKALKSAKDSETFKAFLTSRIDQYRAPYSRRVEQRPRMCVFAGTTNSMNIFVDKTGNRRFLPVITSKGKNTKSLFDDYKSVDDDFRNAWAEALKIFEESNRMPTLKLPDHVEAEALEMQLKFCEDDYRVGVIQNWLDQTDAVRVCVPMLIEKALEGDLNRYPKHAKREIFDIMDNEIEGWERIRNDKKGRTWFTDYGNQVTYLRN